MQLLGGGGQLGLGGLMGFPGRGGTSEEGGQGGGMGQFGAMREKRAAGPNNGGFSTTNFHNGPPNSINNAPFLNNNNNNNNINDRGNFAPVFFRNNERWPNFSSFAAGLSSGIVAGPQRIPDPKFIPQSSNLIARNFMSANPQFTLSFQPAKPNNFVQSAGCNVKDSGVPIFG